MNTVVDANEEVILNLLKGTYDWVFLSKSLLTYAKTRPNKSGMEKHHVEPLRKEVIFLWPLEHLAIHICEAKLGPSDQTHAKVGAFVKSFPGSYRRLLQVSESLREKILSFGQKRPSRTSEIMQIMSNLPQSKEAQRKVGSIYGAVNGKKSACKVSRALKGRNITWGKKISEAIDCRGIFTCKICGKVMKNIPSNVLQHQRSKKCR